MRTPDIGGLSCFFPTLSWFDRAVPQAGIRERKGHHRLWVRPRVHLHLQRPRLHPAHVPGGPKDSEVSL